MKLKAKNQKEEVSFKIRKQHIIKLVLWISGIAIALFWLAMVITTSVSAGELRIYGEAITPLNDAHFKELANKGYVPFIENDKVYMRALLEVKDMNPLCLTYTSDLTGWYMFVLFTPIGFMLCIFIIAWIKNNITPEAIKEANRKGLQYGYLRQDDVEYINNEIDYNVGYKQRPPKDNKNLSIEELVKLYEREKEK